jgi:hypothetical protein
MESDIRRWMRLVESDATSLIAFHGTRKNFEQFDPKFFGTSSDRGYLGVGFYFSTSFNTAATYAVDSPTGRVLKCRLTLNSPYKMQVENPVQYQNHFHHTDIRAWLLKYGYDGVICVHSARDEDDEQSTEVMILNANQIDILEKIDPNTPS